MTKTTRLVRTIYLYAAALISLIFVAVGAGNLLNTALKAYVFTKAERTAYGPCNQPPAVEFQEKTVSANSSDDAELAKRKAADYEKWQEENMGEKCLQAERQRSVADALTMLIIALPIYVFHWRIIRREREEKESELNT